MDDLKLFAQDKNALESMMQVVYVRSQAIGMSSGLWKCAQQLKCAQKAQLVAEIRVKHIHGAHWHTLDSHR